jgi:two-component system, NarL family, invasion response regulator UvrY
MSTAPVAVLVVDDHAPFRAAARAVIARTAGFALAGEAVTGEEAMDRAADLRPGLVLMDIDLPGIDGIEATRRIVANHAGIVVYLCSTYALDDLPPDARTCGALGYVRKEELGPAVLRRLWEGQAGGAGWERHR